MRAHSIVILTASAALLAGAAMAQNASPQDTAPPAQADVSQAAPPQDAAPMASPTDTGQAAPTSSLGSSDHPIPQNSPTAPEMAYKLTPNDPNVVTNGPVPDTPQNRKLYGKPLSHGGKSTAATGD